MPNAEQLPHRYPALAAIALPTRRKWLEYGMFGAAGIGLVLGGLAAAHM